MIWPPENSLIPLADQVREADMDTVITATPDHLDVLTPNSVMSVVGVETICPRMTFGRWVNMRPGVSG